MAGLLDFMVGAGLGALGAKEQDAQVNRAAENEFQRTQRLAMWREQKAKDFELWKRDNITNPAQQEEREYSSLLKAEEIGYDIAKEERAHKRAIELADKRNESESKLTETEKKNTFLAMAPDLERAFGIDKLFPEKTDAFSGEKSEAKQLKDFGDAVRRLQKVGTEEAMQASSLLQGMILAGDKSTFIEYQSQLRRILSGVGAGADSGRPDFNTFAEGVLGN